MTENEIEKELQKCVDEIPENERMGVLLMLAVILGKERFEAIFGNVEQEENKE